LQVCCISLRFSHPNGFNGTSSMLSPRVPNLEVVHRQQRISSVTMAVARPVYTLMLLCTRDAQIKNGDKEHVVWYMWPGAKVRPTILKWRTDSSASACDNGSCKAKLLVNLDSTTQKSKIHAGHDARGAPLCFAQWSELLPAQLPLPPYCRTSQTAYLTFHVQQQQSITWMRRVFLGK
jgi:hypothetical protein